MRSQLMASIYDKALKRKDYSGIIDKNKLAKDAAENTSAKDGHVNSKSTWFQDHNPGRTFTCR
jgi:hypothetical protein